MTRFMDNTTIVTLAVDPDRYRSPPHYSGALLTFEEIFEQDARWIMGKTIISDVVAHIKGKSLQVKADVEAAQLNIEASLPTVFDEISRTEESIIWMVPPELFQIFLNRLNKATNAYLGDEGAHMLGRFIRSPVNAHTVASIQAELAMIERTREAHGEGELWKFVADYLGMHSLVQFPLRVTYTVADTSLAKLSGTLDDTDGAYYEAFDGINAKDQSK